MKTSYYIYYLISLKEYASKALPFVLVIFTLSSMVILGHDRLGRKLVSSTEHAGNVTLVDSFSGYFDATSNLYYEPSLTWSALDSKGVERTENYDCTIRVPEGTSFKTVIKEHRYDNGDVELILSENALEAFFCRI